MLYDTATGEYKVRSIEIPDAQARKSYNVAKPAEYETQLGFVVELTHLFLTSQKNVIEKNILGLVSDMQ